MNPSVDLFPALICGAFEDVEFFGPNYVDSKTLNDGLEVFCSKKKPFDILLIGTWIPILEAHYKNTIKFLSNKNLSSHEILNFYNDVKLSLKNIPIKTKAIIGVGLDYYAMQRTQIDFIDENELYVICPGLEFIKSFSELEDYSRFEKHFIRKKDIFSDVWKDYVKNNPHKIINFLHYVSFHEFFYKAIKNRKYNINIPGIDYFKRREASNKIKKLKLKLPNKNFYYTFRILNKIGFPVFKNQLSLKLFNTFYFNNLSESKIAYTAPGCFGMPIRKYFEIPASGSLFICLPCQGFKAIGFKNEVNCITADSDELCEFLKKEKDFEKLQKIVNNAQKLIISKHSIKARGEQLKSCFKLIMENKYESSKWVDGVYILNEKLKK
tara:strand:- start:60 stop:1202 length:1143 start_codon:yes stop_codon:yes gene_type:complete